MRWRSVLWAAAPVVAAVLSSTALGQGAAKRVEVAADSLSVDAAGHTARFEGNVSARLGDLEITCDEMTATYDDSGAIASLEARGRVTVRRADASAEASVARLDAKGRLLILEGAPSVKRGPHRISGKRIAVHLDTLAIEVLEARGSFSLPLGGDR